MSTYHMLLVVIRTGNTKIKIIGKVPALMVFTFGLMKQILGNKQTNTRIVYRV